MLASVLPRPFLHFRAEVLVLHVTAAGVLGCLSGHIGQDVTVGHPRQALVWLNMRAARHHRNSGWD